VQFMSFLRSGSQGWIGVFFLSVLHSLERRSRSSFYSPQALGTTMLFFGFIVRLADILRAYLLGLTSGFGALEVFGKWWAFLMGLDCKGVDPDMLWVVVTRVL
jgi:hypothetical protein